MGSARGWRAISTKGFGDRDFNGVSLYALLNLIRQPIPTQRCLLLNHHLRGLPSCGWMYFRRAQGIETAR